VRDHGSGKPWESRQDSTDAGQVRFQPYDAESLAFYSQKSAQKATAAKAQNALESLRNHSPALVWKSARGEYAVDDAAMYEWFTKRQAANTWPPKAPDIQPFLG
jgi:hypothetical protein